MVTLFTYKEGQATLFTICNDYGHNPVVRELHKCSGDIYMKFYKAAKGAYTQTATLSIWVAHLSFTDPETHEIISFDDELFWKVPDDMTMAG